MQDQRFQSRDRHSRERKPKSPEKQNFYLTMKIKIPCVTFYRDFSVIQIKQSHKDYSAGNDGIILHNMLQTTDTYQ